MVFARSAAAAVVGEARRWLESVTSQPLDQSQTRRQQITHSYWPRDVIGALPRFPTRMEVPEDGSSHWLSEAVGVGLSCGRPRQPA